MGNQQLLYNKKGYPQIPLPLFHLYIHIPLDTTFTIVLKIHPHHSPQRQSSSSYLRLSLPHSPQFHSFVGKRRNRRTKNLGLHGSGFRGKGTKGRRTDLPFVRSTAAFTKRHPGITLQFTYDFNDSSISLQPQNYATLPRLLLPPSHHRFRRTRTVNDDRISTSQYPFLLIFSRHYPSSTTLQGL